jgi:NAD(P)-dependent dehydrogenase (short-subunit alcohol dehydrogenase family)
MLSHILKEGREEFIAKIPLGRIGQAEEVASVIEFLCGLSTTYITPRSSM